MLNRSRGIQCRSRTRPTRSPWDHADGPAPQTNYIYSILKCRGWWYPYSLLFSLITLLFLLGPVELRPARARRKEDAEQISQGSTFKFRQLKVFFLNGLRQPGRLRPSYLHYTGSPPGREQSTWNFATFQPKLYGRRRKEWSLTQPSRNHGLNP